jgi:hypothetical protein
MHGGFMLQLEQKILGSSLYSEEVDESKKKIPQVHFSDDIGFFPQKYLL